MASICSQCKNIFERRLDSGWHVHHSDHDSFKQAVAAGCYMCKALASEIRTYGETVLDLNVSAQITYTVVDVSLLNQFIVVLHWQEQGKKVHEREFSIRKLENQFDETARDYATLSHRWSSGPTVTLLVEHLESFTSPQPISDLPATFRDAITVALELGLGYIWIDCLCIIQDSDQMEDWNEQGTEMCNIYTNAVVNISATGVPNNTHSFLGAYEGRGAVPLPPTIQHRWRSHYQEDQPKPVQDLDSSSKPHEKDDGMDDIWYIVDPYFWWAEVTNTVLLSRGWVFQERYLAPRVLHFGANQLLWECTTLDACETYPRGLPDYVKSGGHTDIKRLKLDDTVISTTDRPKQMVTGPQVGQLAPGVVAPDASLQVWCDLVQAYTRTNLTKQSDKLVAFAGVAELVKKLYHEAERPRPNDGYVAGIFERHLIPMLEWHTNRFPGATTRPREYRAPTWSWASIDGRAWYEFLPHVLSDPSGLPWPPLWAQTLRRDRYMASIPAPGTNQGASWVPLVFDVAVGADTTDVIPEHPQQPRQVPRHSIKLRGHILPLQSVALVNAAREQSRREPILVEEDIEGDVFIHDSNRTTTRAMINRPCLPLRCLKLVGRDSRPKHWVTGLVLQPHPEREAVYSRCGFFAVLSTKGAERIGIHVSAGSDPFRAEFAEDMEISSIEII
ncbi:hypothetical protein PG988_003291 [Apiospora saccharicola]